MGASGGPSIVHDSSLALGLDAADKNSYIGSGTDYSDLSPNGNDGTLSDASIGTDTPGTMHIDGSSDFVDCGNATSLQITGTAISAFVWINADSLVAWSLIFGNASGGSWADGWALLWSGDVLKFSINHYDNVAGFVGGLIGGEETDELGEPAAQKVTDAGLYAALVQSNEIMGRQEQLLIKVDTTLNSS